MYRLGGSTDSQPHRYGLGLGLHAELQSQPQNSQAAYRYSPPPPPNSSYSSNLPVPPEGRDDRLESIVNGRPPSIMNPPPTAHTNHNGWEGGNVQSWQPNFQGSPQHLRPSITWGQPHSPDSGPSFHPPTNQFLPLPRPPRRSTSPIPFNHLPVCQYCKHKLVNDSSGQLICIYRCSPLPAVPPPLSCQFCSHELHLVRDRYGNNLCSHCGR